MNTRPLNQKESENLVCLNKTGQESALLFLTETGLAKSILDATGPIRNLFKTSNTHDYAEQHKGEQYKKILESDLLLDDQILKVKLSLYRPTTKDGDPRMWFYGLKNHASQDEVCAIFIHNKKPILLNLTRANIAQYIAKGLSTPATRFISNLSTSFLNEAEELINKLREISNKGYIRAVGTGDTAVGMSIEAALGITPNSLRKPDYKGIEIKSGRSLLSGIKRTRTTLFACVPNWKISHCKSSEEILQRFGYSRNGQFKLYCTISAKSINSLGLMFELDSLGQILSEVFTRGTPKEVAIWDMNTLENRLLEKHNKTFWVKATAHILNGVEHFKLLSVQYTQRPNIPQFSRMLQDGSITMDHLIKRKATGGVSEKGPLFKIWPHNIPELFLGEPITYDLC
jgi:hypothetical protein